MKGEKKFEGNNFVKVKFCMIIIMGENVKEVRRGRAAESKRCSDGFGYANKYVRGITT